MLMEMMTLTGPGRLKTNSFLDTSGQKSPCPAFAISHYFGPHFGDHNLLIFCKICDHFLDPFWITFSTTFGPILGSILGPDRPKKGQDELKRAIKRFTEPIRFRGLWKRSSNWFPLYPFQGPLEKQPQLVPAVSVSGRGRG